MLDYNAASATLLQHSAQHPHSRTGPAVSGKPADCKVLLAGHMHHLSGLLYLLHHMQDDRTPAFSLDGIGLKIKLAR